MIHFLTLPMAQICMSKFTKVKVSFLHLVYTESVLVVFCSRPSHACVTEKICLYFNQFICLYKPRNISLSLFSSFFCTLTTVIVFWAPSASQNAGDLHSLLCLNTSCVYTDKELRILLLLLC